MWPSLTKGTQDRAANGQNGMVHITERPGTKADPAARLATPSAPPALAVGLAVAAMVETVFRQAPAATSGMFVLLLCLLGLAGTLPLALPQPVVAAGLIT